MILMLVLRYGRYADLASLLVGCTMAIFATLHSDGDASGVDHDVRHGVHRLLTDPYMPTYVGILTLMPLLGVVVFELWYFAYAIDDFEDALSRTPIEENWRRVFDDTPSAQWHVRCCALCCFYASAAASLLLDLYTVAWYNLLYVPLRVAALMFAHEISCFAIRHVKND